MPRVPLGAQVIVDHEAPDGSPTRRPVGRVVRSDGARYVVSLTGGRFVEATVDQLTPVRASPSADDASSTVAAAGMDGPGLVTEHTIYIGLVGPTAGGLGVASGGADIRGVYQAPTSAFWSLAKPPKHVTGPAAEWFSWEVEHFCELALEANPACLELLWSTHPMWVSDVGHELLDLRGAFLSQAIAPAYGAYVAAELKLLEGREPADMPWDRAVYLLRVLIDGAALLRSGDVSDPADGHRDRLLEIRAGKQEPDNVEAWRLELQRSLDEAAASSLLPPAPETDRVNAWLGQVRRRHL